MPPIDRTTAQEVARIFELAIAPHLALIHGELRRLHEEHARLLERLERQDVADPDSVDQAIAGDELPFGVAVIDRRPT